MKTTMISVGSDRLNLIDDGEELYAVEIQTGNEYPAYPEQVDDNHYIVIAFDGVGSVDILDGFTPYGSDESFTTVNEVWVSQDHIAWAGARAA